MQNKSFLVKIGVLIVAILIVIVSGVIYKKVSAPEIAPIPSIEILGNKEDLISFSVEKGQKVSGIWNATGTVKGGYFFEANILVNILDGNKNLLKSGYGSATTDWMTTGPVTFNTVIDFTGLPVGNGFIEIKKDDPSDGEGGPVKKILIPVIIE